ncbi:MAG: hypothetical protein OSA48_11710 [Akkermansiaceae bacterium]|nr:hypothetical protein [Akkermansiaceae bacterium]
MKCITILSLLAVGSVLAGEKTPISEKSPIIPPAPSPYQWFAGATAGYLLENDEEMYTAHIGVDLSNQLRGWDQAIYLEVGYIDICYSVIDSSQSIYGCLDMEIIPVTLNYKLEKQVSQSLNAYCGLGAGMAFIDVEASGLGSADDTVFYAQLFGGVLYNVNSSWELYAGARVIYFEDDDLESIGVDIENTDCLVEIGARHNF